ncbi:hypothetical protein LSCM1_04750 [Leishmania martiniquensis]|uniref:DUF5745 domain-containing protein n=1 Tax=Leishmania martiniquensis TaxID=1580590 RepID=A0A836HK95_9TRYP|nr:hypothetical protein LSCM1_04750 [Leishmania martiniquensis]
MSIRKDNSSAGGSGDRHSEVPAYPLAANVPAMHRISDPKNATASTHPTAQSSSSARDGAEGAASRSAAMPLYITQSPQHQPQQTAFTTGMPTAIMSKAPPPIQQSSSSSSPPTPSPLSTSGSERNEVADHPSRSETASAAGAPGGAAVPVRRPAVGASGSGARLSAAGLIPSASIHAAAAAAAQSASIAGLVFAPGTGTPPPAAGATTSASPGPPMPSPLLPPVPTMATTPATEEAAKEAQRQQILGLANALLTFCSIGNTRVTSIRQCTSSFFVLLYQRLFDCTIAGIDRSPNTAEKRRHNVMLVLEHLRQHPYSLEDIEAEEVVKLNEDHISRLIMVFVQVAEDMRQQQELQQQRQQAAMAASLSAMPGQQGVSVGPHSFAHPAHAEDFGAAVAPTRAYAPVGYTVAEVLPPFAPQQAGSAGAGSGSYHYPQQVDNFYVAPAPPLNGGVASGGSSPYMIAGGGDLGEGVSPSSVSHYLDSSAVPTDNLLEEWYRNLVYPPAGAPAEETEVMSAVDPGHVSLHGVHSQRRHTRSDALGREAGASLTSSGSPKYRTRERRASSSPAERRSPAGRHQRHHRAQLDADDIVRRFRRLEEALDAQERRHRKPFVESSPSPAIGRCGPAERELHESRHRRHPEAQPASSALDRYGSDLAPVGDEQGTPKADSDVILHQDAPLPSQQPLRSQPPTQRQRHPPNTPAHRFAAEPPLTQQERYFLAHRSQHRIDAAQRDRKIERLRSARYLGDMQQLLRQRMRHEYDTQISAMRGSLKQSIRTAREEKMDLMRRVRDENARYRAAYATLMEAAANEAQVPARVMSRHTARLADYYATALQHSHAVCESLKREADRRTKNELLRYAEELSAWQQHFLV